MYQGNRGDLEVHRADTNSLLPQSLELVRRTLVERQDLPFGEKIKKSDKTFVIRHLPMDIGVAANQPQPSPCLLFDGDHGRCDFSRGKGFQTCLQGKGFRRIPTLKSRDVIGVEDHHTLVLRLSSSRTR